MTVFQPAASGHLVLFPAGAIGVKSGTTGTVHLVLDVAGYFE